MSVNQMKVLSGLDKKKWVSRTMLVKSTLIPLSSVARILNRFEAMGCVELADINEVDLKYANHYRITNDGIRELNNVSRKVNKTPEIEDQRAKVRSKLHHLKDEIDKIIEWVNQQETE